MLTATPSFLGIIRNGCWRIRNPFYFGLCNVPTPTQTLALDNALVEHPVNHVELRLSIPTKQH